MSIPNAASKGDTRGLQIFKYRECRDYGRGGPDPQSTGGNDSVVEDGVSLLVKSGFAEGYSGKVLFDAPGFCMVQLWFRGGFPLPLHKHNTDCLYYVISGSIQIGTQKLGAGDGFFVPADVPYGGITGDDGFEYLEIRQTLHKNVTTRFLSTNPEYWQKLAGIVSQKRDGWRSESPPSSRQIS